jgi:hypothetical protein
MRYEVKSFSLHSSGPQDPRTAEEKATEWLNEIAKKNGRPVSITTSPISIAQQSTAGPPMFTVTQSMITVIAVFD